MIIIDMSNLAYRSYFALRGKKGISQPVVWGILRDMGVLSRSIQNIDFVFCFDSDHYLRRRELPSYKPKKEVSEGRSEIQEQLDLLREEILPEIGYGNVLMFPGAEADDLMGMVCKTYAEKFWLVTSDKDVYQLLQENRVFVWDVRLKKPVTHWNICHEEMVTPEQWVLYKSITGCLTDNIPGIPGMGPVKAASFIRKTCKEDGPVQKKIVENWSIVERNRRLIHLPYHALDGHIRPILVRDEIQSGTWDGIMTKYGFESLIGKVPHV